MIPATSRHHPRIRHRAYSRYFAPGQQDFDDNFFPVLWSENGYRTPWLDGYAGQEIPIDAFSSDAVLTLGDEQINVEPWAAAAG